MLRSGLWLDSRPFSRQNIGMLKIFKRANNTISSDSNQDSRYQAVVSDVPLEYEAANSRLHKYEPRTHKTFLLVGIILAIIIIFTATYISTIRTSFRSSAQSPGSATSVSLSNSYVFASPLAAIPDGVSIIRITVFVLNNQGLGVSDTEVILKNTESLNISKTQPVTDSFGRAIFDVNSSTAGSYTISASVGGSALPQKVSVSFQ